MEAAPPLFGDADRRQSCRQPVAQRQDSLGPQLFGELAVPSLDHLERATVLRPCTVRYNEDTLAVFAAVKLLPVAETEEDWLADFQGRLVSAHVELVQSHVLPIWKLNGISSPERVRQFNFDPE